ncbi:MAG: NUDIX hydrolase [Gaiellaceae bacterium]
MATGLVRRGEELLMVLQAGPGEEAYWTVPGGRSEPGEFVGDALVREVLEETGIRVLDPGALAFLAQVDDLAEGWFSTVWTWDVAAWEGELGPRDPRWARSGGSMAPGRRGTRPPGAHQLAAPDGALPARRARARLRLAAPGPPGRSRGVARPARHRAPVDVAPPVDDLSHFRYEHRSQALFRERSPCKVATERRRLHPPRPPRRPRGAARLGRQS